MRMLVAISLLIMLPAVGAAAAEGNFIRYLVGSEEHEGYYISPAEDAPLVLLVHDWDGLTDYEVKRAQMLAEQGYAVFALDMFGKEFRPTTTAEKKQLTGALYADRKQMRRLLNVGYEIARGQGANVDNAVAMGYCFGGAVVLEYARSGADLKGFVTFHGGLTTPDGQDYSDTRGEVLVFHGTADSAVTMDDFARLAQQLEKQSVGHEMITYSGAPHAFTVFGSERYREDADRKSWDRFLEVLQAWLR